MPLKALLAALILKILISTGYTVKPPPGSDPAVLRGQENIASIERVLDKLTLDPATTKAVTPPTRREALARLLLVFGFFEGSWYASPKGDNDAGTACGVLQVHAPQLLVEGATCTKVRASMDLGYEVGLRLILREEDKCGSLGASLTMFAMGPWFDPKTKKFSCPPFVLPAIQKRCKIAGLTADCRPTGA